jgi:hypothetical protein
VVSFIYAVHNDSGMPKLRAVRGRGYVSWRLSESILEASFLLPREG